MSKLDNLIDFGRTTRTVSSRRGALIQLVKEKTYLTNERHTVVFEVSNDFGTGRFYAGEAPKGIVKVQLRGDKTLFVTESKGSTRHILVPTKADVKDEIITALNKYWYEPTVIIPLKAFSAIDPNILMTNISIHQNEMVVTQKRADGTVEIESVINLNHGFIVQEADDTDMITVYTEDFLLLRQFSNPKLSIISKDLPLIVKGTLKGMPVRGLISYHKYEV